MSFAVDLPPSCALFTLPNHAEADLQWLMTSAQRASETADAYNDQTLLCGGLTLSCGILSLMTALSTDARWAAVMMGVCGIVAMVGTLSAGIKEKKWSAQQHEHSVALTRVLQDDDAHALFTQTARSCADDRVLRFLTTGRREALMGNGDASAR